jgi:nicotinamidase/pyrazinamidase
MKKALILVDIQNDFIPGGALAVSEGDAVIDVANRAMVFFDLIIATQDWHPADHGSFASLHPGRVPGDPIELAGLYQILWPDHCVMNTYGAEFAQGLDVDKITKVFRKGVDKDVDSYSGFFDNGQRHDTGLGDYLKSQGVEEVALVGLATDYCVKFTALDARKLGFRTMLIKEGVRGVELNTGDCEKAINDMQKAGVEIMSINDFQTV